MLLPDLRAALDALGVAWEALVVDSGPSAGTREVVEAAGARYIEETEPGYGGALMQGVRAARGRYVISMDADLSHPAGFVRELWAARDRGDLVIASRYVAGGRAEQPLLRQLLSRILNALFRIALGTGVRDLSSGYRLYRADSVRDLRPELRNFAVLVELLLLVQARGGRVAEIPFHYQPRRHGQSHARILAFGWDYAWLLVNIGRIRRRAGS